MRTFLYTANEYDRACLREALGNGDITEGDFLMAMRVSCVGVGFEPEEMRKHGIALVEKIKRAEESAPKGGCQ
jgi:hypothetical protein